jgi:hypothetical protein
VSCGFPVRTVRRACGCPLVREAPGRAAFVSNAEPYDHQHLGDDDEAASSRSDWSNSQEKFLSVYAQEALALRANVMGKGENSVRFPSAVLQLLYCVSAFCTLLATAWFV